MEKRQSINEKITITEIKNGIELSIENSLELIEEAEILFKCNKYARVYTLTQLALEEIGKSILLFSVYHKLQGAKRKEIDFKLLNKNFRNHRDKTFEVIFIDLIIKGRGKSGAPSFKNIVEDNFKKIQQNKKGYFDQSKNKSLYVSYDGKEFKKPQDLITKKISSEFLNEAKKKIIFSSNDTIKWLKMDEYLGVDKEDFIIDLERSIENDKNNSIKN